MKRTWKQIGSLLLVLCMVMTMLPTVASASGEGWTLDDGHLTITSDAGMDDWTEAASSDNLTLKSSVTALTIGKDVTIIPTDAFSSCNHLATVTFEGPPAVTSIGGIAFAYCALTGFAVPASVTSIDPSAFVGTPIAAFTVAGGNTAYKASAEGALLTYDGATLYIFPMGKTGEYTVEGGITAIGEGAFSGTRLSTVVIPVDVASIGAEAFIGSSSLTAVVFQGDTPPAITGNNIFQYCQYLASIYVPAGKVTDYQSAAGLTAYTEKIKANPGPDPSVTDAAGLKAALEYVLTLTITVADNITLSTATLGTGTNDTYNVAMGANHTLNMNNKSLTIGDNKYISTNGKNLTINGGGTLTVANTTYNGIRGGAGTGGTSGGTLNLAAVTVNLENTGTNGGLYNMNITVGSDAIINLNSQTAGGQIHLGNGQTLTINAGGEVNVNDFWSSGIRNAGGTVHVNGGTLSVGAGSGQNQGIVNTGGGLLKVTPGGILDAGDGSAIYLTEESRVEGMANKFKDRGTDFTASGQVTVGERNAPASESGLTQGTYHWNGSSRFEKYEITVTTQPDDVTVTQGAITGILTAGAAASNGTAGYQWQQYNELTWSYVPIPGATDPSFTIPTDLAVGTYRFTCLLTAALCDDWSTRIATVTVNPPAYSGRGGTNSTPVATPPAETTTSGNTATATTTVTAASNSSGTATAAVTQAQVSEAVAKAAEAAAKQGGGAAAIVEIKVTAPADAKTVETSIPKAAMELAADGKTTALTVSTPVASLSFDAEALSTIAGEAAGAVNISASKVEVSSLSAETQQIIGDRPVFNFSVTSGGQTISQFGGSVSVSVPYTPKAGEDLNAIVIYYINGSGKPEVVSNCSYDPATGTISFKTSHFSQYAVGYNTVTFKDVAESAWYGKAVGFIAARAITTGSGNGNYSPDAKLTRGEFIVMLMKAYGIAPDTNSANNFADAGNTWYTGYLAAAKRLGISGGIGNNLFAPGKEITRQEMFTLLYNALKAIGELPEGNTGKTLSAFNDAVQIASWAKDAMTLMAETGTVSGSGGKLAPEETTTRAQMAQVLYNLMGK